MKTLYIECKMGAAGDMLMAALYELLDETKKHTFLTQMNTIFSDDIHVHAEAKSACGIMGTHMHVHAHGIEESPEADGQMHTHIHEHSHTDEQEHNHSHEHTHVHSHNDHTHEHADEHIHMDGHSHEHTHGGHAHHSYTSIVEQIAHLPLAEDVRSHAAAIYRTIGEAEAKVHNSTLEQIHFHEVGSLDALADVVGCCLLFSMLAPEQIIVSPIHVGSGMVHCAHGILPVPAPATAEILRGVPYYTGGIETELCTPTGAAILSHFATDFGAMPVMNVAGTGIGHGTKELPMLNAVRVFFGETADTNSNLSLTTSSAAPDTKSSDAAAMDQIADISCNLDDMTGEALGYAMSVLFDAGALDVFYIPIQMKKNRPGILLHCFCNVEDEERFSSLVLRHTTTRGVRIEHVRRRKLTCEYQTVDSPYGVLTRKISRGDNIAKAKFEFEDLKRIAQQENLSIQELLDALAPYTTAPRQS